MWVKEDTERFQRVQNKEKHAIETISVFSKPLLSADKKAYVALNERISQKDATNRIIMMQPQNEVGILGSDFDYSALGLQTLKSTVPSKLMNYMKANSDRLRPELLEVWKQAGMKNSGTWTEVFGDNIYAKEFLLAWSYASFIGEIAEAGRDVHDLPTFVNAWIVQNDTELPGQYPAGGPVSRVMDIYKAASNKIDFLAPDIYLADFKGITSDYLRDDNPLFVPESTIDASRAYYIIGEHGALGYSPFGIEDGVGNKAFSKAYGVLHEISHLLLDPANSTMGVLRQGSEKGRIIELEDMFIDIGFSSLVEPSYGIIIRTNENEFYIAGVNLHVKFNSKNDESTLYISEVNEGRFEEEKWKPGRLLNGDDTFHNERVRVYGRIKVSGPTFASDQDRPPQPTADSEFSNANQNIENISTPGIYKVTLYTR
tara:strand:- start:935 stop:2218 length:1284 start_codon:yes stop_codon:yes gene_type:complete